IEDMYAAADDILGNLVKVTPTSKVVGDLALHLVAVGADPAQFEAEPGRFDVPDSVVGFLSGDLGEPPGGWPEPFRTKALAGRTHKPPAADLDDEQRSDLAREPRATLNRLLFPGPSATFAESRETYGDLSVLPTSEYLYGLRAGQEHLVDLEEGKRLILGLQAVGEPDERGFRTLMCTINGQLRPITVRDRSTSPEAAQQEKADPAQQGHVAAPYDGVVTLAVAEGDNVEAGATVATIEAMKMEASITAPVSGIVQRVAFGGTQQVDGGDLVLVLSADAGAR
ncbi:MAG: biotin/lipoyl-containing protein, partial [Nocardioidaceae bacterium]